MKDTEFNLADSLPNRQANSNNENRFALHVCTSCRPSGFPREPKENRPGFCLYNQLDKLLEEQNLKDKIDILPADCLSLCPGHAALHCLHPDLGHIYSAIRMLIERQKI